MGIGYSEGESIAHSCPGCIYPNVIDQLKSQGHANTKAYSLWLNDLGRCLVFLLEITRFLCRSAFLSCDPRAWLVGAEGEGSACLLLGSLCHGS